MSSFTMKTGLTGSFVHWISYKNVRKKIKTFNRFEFNFAHGFHGWFMKIISNIKNFPHNNFSVQCIIIQILLIVDKYVSHLQSWSCLNKAGSSCKIVNKTNNFFYWRMFKDSCVQSPTCCWENNSRLCLNIWLIYSFFVFNQSKHFKLFFISSFINIINPIYEIGFFMTEVQSNNYYLMLHVVLLVLNLRFLWRPSLLMKHVFFITFEAFK